MRVDNRFKIIPFCCFGSENLTNYIDQKGYFSNDIDSFKYMDLCKYGTLEKIYCDQPESFKMKEDKKVYKFFILEYFVIQKEKEFRPFTIYEFEDEYFDIVVFRKKKGNVELHSRYNGYLFSRERGVDVLLGCEYFSFEELFNNYELQDSDGNWQPFGVEE